MADYKFWSWFKSSQTLDAEDHQKCSTIQGKLHGFSLEKISTFFFKARYEECGNTEDEYVAKVMAAYMAAQEQQAEQSRKRRAKGGQGGSRGKGKGKSSFL